MNKDDARGAIDALNDTIQRAAITDERKQRLRNTVEWLKGFLTSSCHGLTWAGLGGTPIPYFEGTLTEIESPPVEATWSWSYEKAMSPEEVKAQYARDQEHFVAVMETAPRTIVRLDTLRRLRDDLRELHRRKEWQQPGRSVWHDERHHHDVVSESYGSTLRITRRYSQDALKEATRPNLVWIDQEEATAAAFEGAQNGLVRSPVDADRYRHEPGSETFTQEVPIVKDFWCDESWYQKAIRVWEGVIGK